MTTMKFHDAIKAATPATTSEPLVTFGPLRLQARAIYQGKEKTLYTFDQAQESVAAKGLVLPRFRDVMEHVIIPGLEGTLTKEQQPVFEDMFRSYGEWTDNAFYRQQNRLYVTTGNKGLIWNGKEYDATAMTVDATPTAYDISGLPSQEWLALERVAKTAPALVNDLYSRPFKDLPRKVRNNAGLYLPRDGTVRPVGRGLNFNYLYADSSYDGAARGVKFSVPSEIEVPSSSSSRIAQ